MSFSDSTDDIKLTIPPFPFTSSTQSLNQLIDQMDQIRIPALNLSKITKGLLPELKLLDIKEMLEKDKKKQQKIWRKFEEKRTKNLTDFFDTTSIIDITKIPTKGIVQPLTKNPKYPEPGNRDINDRIVMTEDGWVSDKPPKP